MSKCRLRFSKLGRAKYISHLDLMRTFQRAFMRSKVSIKHTEGFNPHVYISIALPLQLGCESLCEILDIETSDETPISTIPERLNPFLPEGIVVTLASEPIKKPSAIKFLKCRSQMVFDTGTAEEVAIKMREFFSQDDITIMKRTKRGQAELNLAPYIKSFELIVQSEDKLTLEAIISAQNPTINPSHLISALNQLAKELTPSFSSDSRIEIYAENLVIFS